MINPAQRYVYPQAVAAVSGENGDGGCCRQIARTCRAVANFFKILTITIFAGINWVFKNLCCCHNTNNNSGSVNHVIHNVLNARQLSEIQIAANILDHLADGSLIRDYAGVIGEDDWQEPPAEWLSDVPSLDVPLPPTAPVAPRIISEDVRIKQAESLARLNEIKNRLDHDAIKFELVYGIVHFNCDEAFRPFASNTPAIRLRALLDYAGPEIAKPYNPNNPKDSLREYMKRVEKVNREHAVRSLSFNSSLQRHLNSEYEGETGGAAKRSLSQIFNILNAKKRRADQNLYDKDALKNEIRWVATSINDAHRDCIDQINAQLNFIKLKIIVTELGNGVGLDAINIFGAHALFEYRNNLLTEICRQQNPNPNSIRYDINREHPHLADIVQAIKHRLAAELNLESRENVGAEFNNALVTEKMIKNARDGFFHLHNTKPAAEINDRRPLTYLKEGLKPFLKGGPLQDLRTTLINWITEKLCLDADQPNKEDAQVIEQIITAASLYPGIEADENDPEDYSKTNFKCRGPFNEAGMLWLLESAGFIKEA